LGNAASTAALVDFTLGKTVKDVPEKSTDAHTSNASTCWVTRVVNAGNSRVRSIMDQWLSTQSFTSTGKGKK